MSYVVGILRERKKLMNGAESKFLKDEKVVVKKSGFQLSIEGNQEFPPKTVSMKKIGIDWGVEGGDKTVEVIVKPS